MLNYGNSCPKTKLDALMRICIMLPLISVPENESEISKYEIVLPKTLSRCKRANLNAHKMKTDDNFTKLAGKTYNNNNNIGFPVQFRN